MFLECLKKFKNTIFISGTFPGLVVIPDRCDSAVFAAGKCCDSALKVLRERAVLISRLAHLLWILCDLWSLKSVVM